jgi:polysaccharide biosynthesis protein VpsQ
MKQSIWRWLAVGFLLFMLAVAVAADMDTIPNFVRNIYRFQGGDKLGHFVLYGILAFLAAHAFPRRVNILGWMLPLSALLVLLMAILEELSQFWFPHRTPDIYDLSFGVLGIIVGTWLAGRRK